MEAIKTLNTTGFLRKPNALDDCFDLPITEMRFVDGSPGVESCWELSEEELLVLIDTKKIYFLAYSQVHPSIDIAVKSFYEPIESQTGLIYLVPRTVKNIIKFLNQKNVVINAPIGEAGVGATKKLEE